MARSKEAEEGGSGSQNDGDCRKQDDTPTDHAAERRGGDCVQGDGGDGAQEVHRVDSRVCRVRVQANVFRFLCVSADAACHERVCEAVHNGGDARCDARRVVLGKGAQDCRPFFIARIAF